MPRLTCRTHLIEGVPIDKLWIRVEKPLPNLNWSHVRENRLTMKLHKKLTKSFIVDNNKSFALNILNHPVFILSNRSFTQIQFNPVFHSFPFMQIFPLLIFGDDEFKITHLHVNSDIRISFIDAKQFTRIGFKSSVETYCPGTYSSSYSKKEGRKVFLPKSTEYIGKNNKVVIYDSGVKHGIGKDVSRVEIRINQEKKLNYLTLEKIEKLIDIEPFKNIHLPLAFNSLSETNEKHIEYFKDFMADHALTAKESMIEIRKIDKSKADCIARAFRLRDKLLFNFDKAYRINFKHFLSTKLREDEKQLIARMISIHSSRISSM